MTSSLETKWDYSGSTGRDGIARKLIKRVAKGKMEK